MMNELFENIMFRNPFIREEEGSEEIREQIYLSDLDSKGVVEVGRKILEGEDGQVIILGAYRRIGEESLLISVTANVIDENGEKSGAILCYDYVKSEDEAREILKRKIKSYKLKEGEIYEAKASDDDDDDEDMTMDEWRKYCIEKELMPEFEKIFSNVED